MSLFTFLFSIFFLSLLNVCKESHLFLFLAYYLFQSSHLPSQPFFMCLLFFYVKSHSLKVCSQVAHFQVIFIMPPASNRKLSSLCYVLEYARHYLSQFMQGSPQNYHCFSWKRVQSWSHLFHIAHVFLICCHSQTLVF